MFISLLIFLCTVIRFLCAVFFYPGPTYAPAHILASGFENLTLFVIYVDFVRACVRPPTKHFFPVQTLTRLVFSVLLLPYSGYHILLFLGWVPCKSLDCTCLLWCRCWFSFPPPTAVHCNSRRHGGGGSSGMATALYFYESILVWALKSKIIVLLTFTQKSIVDLIIM